MRRNITPRTALFLSLGLMIPVAACGDDAVVEPADQGDTLPTVPTTAPPTPTTAAPATGYDHPTGADEAVIEVNYEGGFAPVGAFFTQLPSAIVTGDGRQITPGATTMIYPGALVPFLEIGDIGEDGVQALLTLADQYGLLQQRDYEAPTNIADAPDTVVTIQAGGETYVHRAYALGIDMGLDEAIADQESDDPRVQLQAFVEEATRQLATSTEAFEPAAYLVRATPVTDMSGYEIDPTIVTWPLDVALADASECMEIPAADIGETFADANQLTFFEQSGATYQLAVKPLLPGGGC